ncbi:nucleoside-diphosphate-sugar epimerase [Ahrensia sp. R2A130]|nr:nucleoside-diphosphate-sugar epimerase [Ahrensia sp. R2A130]
MLGTALASNLRSGPGYTLCPIPRDVIGDANRQSAETILLEVLEDTLQEDIGADINLFYCVGLIDPKAAPDKLTSVNASYPIWQYHRLCEWADANRDRVGRVQMATFGSAFETLPEVAKSNPYLRSKRELYEHWQGSALHDIVPWHHFQMHTLYGGHYIQWQMFSGLIAKALQDDVPFKMSDGSQIREYHHVADIAQCIINRLGRPDIAARPALLSSGRAVALRDLAEHIFAALGKSDLLQVGSLPSPVTDNYETRWSRSSDLIVARDPLTGMVDWLSDNLNLEQSK